MFGFNYRAARTIIVLRVTPGRGRVRPLPSHLIVYAYLAEKMYSYIFKLENALPAQVDDQISFGGNAPRQR